MIPISDNNPTHHFPIITLAIITLSVAVFLWQLSLGPTGQQAVALSLGTVPSVLFGSKQLPPELQILPAEATLITSMFLHGGWMHLIGNMLYLWIFGNNIEDAMGHKRFVLFYLLSGVLAALAFALPNIDSTIPMIGASGAISGVLGAYLILYPRAKILVLIPLGFFLTHMRLSAIWVLGFWIILQVINSLITPSTGGGVAWGAHLGGFVAGMLLIPFFKYRSVPYFSHGNHGKPRD